jgi:hypothetical protein
VPTDGIWPRAWYCKERLPAIRQDRVATGDEVHMEPTIAVGGVKRKGSQRQYRYHWGADGNPTPTATAETTLGPRKFIQQVKYTEQTRVMLATALTPEDHPRAKKYPGIALPTYDYTGKWLDSIPVFEERCEEQKRHIQKKGAVSRWVTGRREGELYPDDGVEHFSGIQTVVAQQLCGLGVSTVRIVAKLSDLAIKQLATARHSGEGAVEGKLSPRTGRWSKGGRKQGKMIVAGLSEPFLTEMREQAQAACARAAAPGGQTSHPTQKDHRRERDPYASRYLAAGEAERQLVADVRTKGNVCVTELATALWGAAATFYRKCGETHPDQDPEKYGDWWVYHDALAQLCEKRGREWMEKMGYYEHWIVPLHGLNDRIYGKTKNGDWTFSTVFGGRPPGDSPEWVNLDCHLNKDARDCTEFHAAITSDLASSDPNKIDLSTYVRQRDALLRLVHVRCDCTADVCICGALPPKRIHEDGTKCLKDHFVKVHKVHGTVVDGLGNRNGERRLKAVWSVKSKNHGGARPTRKQRLEEIETNGFGQVWVHRHARAEWHKCAGIEEEEVSMEGSDSCNYCLHPDVCLCAFSKVTPGCCNKYNSE